MAEGWCHDVPSGKRIVTFVAPYQVWADAWSNLVGRNAAISHILWTAEEFLVTYRTTVLS